MAMLIRGTKFSSRVNQVVVGIKLLVVLTVIVVGVFYVDTSNWVPFIPDKQPVPEGEGGFSQSPLITSLFGIEPAVFGVAGVISGAAVVFFAFIGFDIVATTAEEAKDPKRDVPRGILGSLAIVTVLYMRSASSSPASRTTRRSTPRMPRRSRPRSTPPGWSGWAT